MLLLTTDETFTSELAAFIRKTGWEPLITNDPVQFGYYLAKKQPAGIVVFTEEVMHSTQRALSVSKTKPTVMLLLRKTTQDRKSTRLNSSHVRISYAVFCLKKKKKNKKKSTIEYT